MAVHPAAPGPVQADPPPAQDRPAMAGHPLPAARSELLTLAEAARETGQSVQAIRARVRRGTLPARKGNDGVWTIRADDLDGRPPPAARPPLAGHPTGHLGGHGRPSTATSPDDEAATLRARLEAVGAELAEARSQALVAAVERDAERRRADATEARLAVMENQVFEARALADRRTEELAKAQDRTIQAEVRLDGARDARGVAEAAAARAEARADAAELELRELRRPWLERLSRLIRG